jgi:hypothetical protein
VLSPEGPELSSQRALMSQEQYLETPVVILGHVGNMRLHSLAPFKYPQAPGRGCAFRPTTLCEKSGTSAAIRAFVFEQRRRACRFP